MPGGGSSLFGTPKTLRYIPRAAGPAASIRSGTGENPSVATRATSRTEAGTEIANQGAPVRIEEAAEEDRVGASPGDASGEALEVPSLGVPVGGADDLEPEVPRRRGHVGPEVVVAVRENEQAPRAQLLDELGVGHGLQVVGGRDADEVSLTRRIPMPRARPGACPGRGA